MSKESLRHLSSLMDGELSRETGLFMARRLSSDQELCETWQRYHLIRDCIRRQAVSGADTDFSNGIRAALAIESEVRSPGWAGRRWLKPVSGFAVAASVAVLAIMVIGPGPQTSNQAANVAGTPGNETFTSPNPLSAVPISQPASFSPDSQDNSRLNPYLVRHNQLAGAAGRQGFVSFVPIISTRAGEQDTADNPRSDGQGEARGAVDSSRQAVSEQP